MPQNVKDVKTNSTRLIPMILASGNHDLGVQSFSQATIPHNTHQPIYKHWFPQNLFEGLLPDLHHRRTFFSHKFGPSLHIISLDTAFASEMGGAQSKWLENILKSSTSTTKIVQYHGPLYPSCDPEDPSDHTVITSGTKHWVPLFDRYNVTLVSENHNHAFKRTKRLSAGVPDQKGIIYIGDGNYGTKVPPEGCTRVNQDIMEKATGEIEEGGARETQ